MIEVVRDNGQCKKYACCNAIADSAMPEPMNPAPTTAIREI